MGSLVSDPGKTGTTRARFELDVLGIRITYKQSTVTQHSMKQCSVSQIL